MNGPGDAATGESGSGESGSGESGSGEHGPSEHHLRGVADLAETADCQATLREIYEYLDGELTAERRANIELHLGDCNPCLAAFDFEAEVRMVVAHRCRDEVPERLRQRIAAALHPSPEP